MYRLCASQSIMYYVLAPHCPTLVVCYAWAQPHQLTHSNKTSYLTLTHQNTDTPHNHVTTPPHRGRVGPSPSKGMATTSNTATQQRKRNLPTHPPSGKRGSRCGFSL